MVKRFFTLGVITIVCLATPKHSSADQIIEVNPLRLCSMPERNEREINCLRGAVRTVRTTVVPFTRRDDHYIEGHPSQIRVETYSPEGNRTEQIVYGFDFNLRQQMDSRTVYTFDANGRATGWEGYSPGQQNPSRAVYIYDDRGRRIRHIVTNPNGIIRSVRTLIYDDHGRNIENIYDNTGSGLSGRFAKYRVVNVFDSLGRIVESTNQGMDGSIFHKNTYTYDDRGQQIEARSYIANVEGVLILNSRVGYGYDNQGQRIEMVRYNLAGVVVSRTVYSYDDKGNMISVITYNADGTFRSRGVMSYEYDSRGNWLRRVHSNQASEAGEAEPYYAENRIITYY